MSHCKESIFTLILKRFFGSFVSVIGFFFAILLFFMIIGFSYKNSAQTIGEILPAKIHSNATGYTTPLNPSASTILQINIHGPIGMSKSNIMNTLPMIKKILRQPAFYNIDMKNVKGIFLNINSPGGAVGETDEIYQEIMAFKKLHNIPVHAWVGDICFSGGYYLACTADHISAQTVSMIGSVGVLSSNPNFNFYGLMQKIGVESTPVSAGKNKVHFPMFAKKEPGTKSYQDILNILDSIYDRFLNVVSSSRAQYGLTKERLTELGATIYYGNKAKELGYIDQANVGYVDALINFATKLGINETGFQVIQFENPMGYLQKFQSKAEQKFSFLFEEETKFPFTLEANLSNMSL